MPWIDPIPEEQRKYQQAKRMLRKLEKSGLLRYNHWDGKFEIQKPERRWSEIDEV